MISTKGGFSYADNEHAAAFLTFLKEAICPLVTVVLLAHDGTKAHRAGGAAAWEEHPSMVIGLEKIKSVDGQELSGKRQFTATKSRKCDERTFFVEKGEDGRLKPCQGTEVIKDMSALITKVMVDAYDNNEDKLHFKVIHERVKERFGSLVSLKTIQNNLSNLTRGNTPRLKRVGTPTGTYRVNDYWLRISRGTQA